MRTTHLIIFFLFSLASTMPGQRTYEIEGRLINQETKEPIQFGNIFNMRLKKGTLSNAEGYFRIPVTSTSDSIQITYIGFKDQTIKLERDVKFYFVYLEENTHLLGEVTVTPRDDFRLYELVNDCRKSASKIEVKSKAHYELKTFIEDDQIELVEGYYNTDIKGYKLAGLHLKNGRLALRPHGNRFFLSKESSIAIIMLNILKGSRHFPQSPLELSKTKMKKSYYLTLDNKYLDEAADSIFIVDFKPKDSAGLFFEGRLWINKSKRTLLKITLRCDRAQRYPFVPLFPTDTIRNFSFDITQSFKLINGKSVFNHIDFVYEVDYASRVNLLEKNNFTVTTKAVLHAYDYDDTFLLPFFDYEYDRIPDYQKINAIPYNYFFWEYNDENRLNDSLNSNEFFFLDSTSLTNITLFKPNQYFKKFGMFQFPYVEWSDGRIKVRELSKESLGETKSMKFKSEQYHLSVKIFLDVNTYKDSTHILTATIFDPYDTYYYLPMDRYTHCFVNIYFDLHEIKRRELEKILHAERSNNEKIMEIYDSFIKDLEVSMSEYLENVKRGTNLDEMMKYSEYVNRELGINNIELFRLLEED